MYKQSIDIPHGDEVTTEPQRRALEAMSHDLVVKLNAMVAEQERRAQEFAAQQHSLSALPSFNLPEIAPPALPQQHTVPPAPAIVAEETAVYGRKARLGTPQAITNGPRLPQVPQSAPQRQSRTAWDTPEPSPRQKEYKMPTIIRETSAEKKENGIGAGTICIIIFILFVLVMHGCD